VLHPVIDAPEEPDESLQEIGAAGREEGGSTVKAYVFFVPEDPGDWRIDGIHAVYLDRDLALDFWIYDLCCYGILDPDPEQIYEAKELFEQAEKDGEAIEHELACVQVKEISQ
jgi:hypothetical protein